MENKNLEDARRQAEQQPSDSTMERDVREIELEMLKQEYRKLMNERLVRIQEILETEPHVIALMACEAALGISEEPNFFEPLEQQKRDAIQTLYRDLPRVMLEDLNGRSINEQHPLAARLRRARDNARKTCVQTPAASGFIKISDWITGQMHVGHFPGWRFRHAERDRMLHDFFDHFEEDFGYAISNACDLIYRGIPLYERYESTEQLTAIPFSHEDYIYLSKKGEHCDQRPTARFPYWADKYFFKQEHLGAQQIFFGGVDSSDSEEKIATLRDAFRRYIGFDRKPSSAAGRPRVHQTRMLTLLDKVLERYYGPEFDPDDPDTWTRQDDVVAWLRETFHGTSDKEARAIDSIARPDAARKR